MIALRILGTIAALICLASCGVTGRYQFSAITFSQSIEIRRDHTFSYGCGSDEIGDNYYAQGTWELDEGGVLVTTIVEAKGTASVCLKPIQRWTVTSAGLTAEGDNELLRRK